MLVWARRDPCDRISHGTLSPVRSLFLPLAPLLHFQSSHSVLQLEKLRAHSSHLKIARSSANIHGVILSRDPCWLHCTPLMVITTCLCSLQVRSGQHNADTCSSCRMEWASVCSALLARESQQEIVRIHWKESKWPEYFAWTVLIITCLCLMFLRRLQSCGTELLFRSN